MYYQTWTEHEWSIGLRSSRPYSDWGYENLEGYWDDKDKMYYEDWRQFVITRSKTRVNQTWNPKDVWTSDNKCRLNVLCKLWKREKNRLFQRKKDKKYKCNAKCNSLIVNVNNSFQIKQQSFPFHFVNHFTDTLKTRLESSWQRIV